MKSHMISIAVLGLLMCAHAQLDGGNSTTPGKDTTTTTEKSTTTHVVTTTSATKPTTTNPKTSTTARVTTTGHSSTTTGHSSTTTGHSTTTEKHTTTSAKTTPTTTKALTTTSKPSGPPRFPLMQNNVTCLLLQATITVAYNYTSDKVHKINNTVPWDAQTYGECGDSREHLSLNWIKGSLTQRLELTFTKGKSDYSLTNVTFTYDDATFGHFTSGKWSTTTDILSTNLDTSYNCTQGVDLTVGQMKMNMKDLLVGGFMDDHSEHPQFLKTGSDCAYDGKTDAIVPIAVGCALAAMVLIVLVGYCIGRRRSAANNYQAMNNDA